MTPKTTHTITSLILLTLTALVWAAPAVAEPRPSSDLLLPYFEVDLSEPGGRTTLFAVGNAASDAVTVKASVTSNWGIEMFATSFELASGEVRTVNLRDWLQTGDLPDHQLGPATLAHVQAALSGQPSPRDDKYYGTQPDPFVTDLAVGAVTLRVTSRPREDALWGDYFWVEPGEDFAEGELLVNIDRSMACRGLCDVHRLRFMDGGGFDGGTQLVIWSPRVGQPADNANGLAVGLLSSASVFHTEPGAEFDERSLELLPVQVLNVRDLLLDEDFGWLDIVTAEDVYVGVRYSASQRYSVAIQTWCMPDEPCTGCGGGGSKKPAVDIEKSTNGVDADTGFGPAISSGSPVNWEYVVTNTGDVALTDVQVSDDKEGAITCPKNALDPGESMTCAKSGQAPALAQVPAGGFFYANVATVVGTPPTGSDVTDSDPSHYNTPKGQSTPPEITIEKATNGHDADAAPGPQLSAGDAVTWSYVVTNTGTETVVGIAVADDKEGAVTCPKSALAPSESMTCSPKQGVAELGQYENVATVTGSGETSEIPVSDDDPSHYYGVEEPVPAIDVEKATNGKDADEAPGVELVEGDAVTWSYVVTNIGTETVIGIAVVDDQEGAVTCPKTALAPDESMTCTPKQGVAALGQYVNTAVVTGSGETSEIPVSDDDPSHYHGVEGPEPAIDVEKATNGHDADQAPGVELEEGDAVTWSYVVTNTGTETVVSIAVADDKEGAVTCPKSVLGPGESMTCTPKHGVAQHGQYENVATVTGSGEGSGQSVSDSDPSHYHGEDEPEECDECEGKIVHLALRYTGSICATVEAVATPEQRFANPTVFGPEVVCPGEVFEVFGKPSSSGGFNGTLGTNLELYVNGAGQASASIHTSCSQEVGPGFVAGAFTVVEGESKHGGPLCPLD